MIGVRVIAAVGAMGIALAGCGGSAGSGDAARAPGGSTSAGATSAAAPSRSATATESAAPRRSRRHRPAPDPGRLPQTSQLPSSHSGAFRAEMQDLWAAVRRDHTAAGRPAFFPETAYAQLKAIGDAAADWQYRLYADYRLDIEAAHALLTAPYSSTHLVGVLVPGQYAHWVDPGVCENRVGYYEVPNARVVYREHGTIRSFGIASMISWRGRWYVIHLGYEGRLSIGGRVDDPSVGVGVSAPSSAC